MKLIASTHGSAYNGDFPYLESVHSDHTILMSPLDVLAVAHLSGYRIPLYPPEGFPSDAPLDTAAYAYVSRYATGGAEISTVPGTKLLDAGHVAIDGCTSVTFTGLVIQGAMSMIGMVFADPSTSVRWRAGVALPFRVVYDAATGEVRYTAETLVLPGAATPDDAALDALALEAARHLAPAAHLRLLTVPERPAGSGALRVDPDSGQLHRRPPHAL